jgi:hypothetical protein
MTVEHDLSVPMRDGVRLFANLYRPATDGAYPVIMSVTPYGKDKHQDRITTFFMRLSGVKFGQLNCSRLAVSNHLIPPIGCSKATQCFKRMFVASTSRKDTRECSGSRTRKITTT